MEWWWMESPNFRPWNLLFRAWNFQPKSLVLLVRRRIPQKFQALKFQNSGPEIWRIHPPPFHTPPFACLFSLLFFFSEKGKENHKKKNARISSLLRTPKVPGKTIKKARNSLQKKKARKSKKARKRRLGFRVIFRRLPEEVKITRKSNNNPENGRFSLFYSAFSEVISNNPNS